MTSDSCDTVVFDLGGVLIDWDPRHLYRILVPRRPRRDGAVPVGGLHTRLEVSSKIPAVPGPRRLRCSRSKYPEYDRLIRAYHLHWG